MKRTTNMRKLIRSLSILGLGLGVVAISSTAMATTGTLNITANTTLTENHFGNIVIDTANVTLDCGGFTVTGTDFAGINVRFSTGVTVENCVVTGFANFGIRVFAGSNNTITNNTVSNNLSGIFLTQSTTNNTVRNNTVNDNFNVGIRLNIANTNTVDNNSLSNNDDFGIELQGSNGNTITNNIVSNSANGIALDAASTNNTIFHNNIIGNTLNQAVDPNPAANNWHDPVSLEGNFWSDYTGVDDGSGSGKHATAGDGIGDTLIPHLGSGFDNFPFVAPIAMPPGPMAPVADAGSDQLVSIGDPVTLDGSGSHDTDSGGTLTFFWTQTGGSTVALTGAQTATPSFTASDFVESPTFRLTVTDTDGNAAMDDVVVTVVEDKDHAIFVSDSLGNGSNPGTMGAPVKTIRQAFLRVTSAIPPCDDAPCDVYVAEGTYVELNGFGVTMLDGVSLYGGFVPGPVWTRTASAPTVIAPIVTSDWNRGQAAIRALNITSSTMIDGFTINSPDGPSSFGSGKNSTGIYVRDSTNALRISNNSINAGRGADGRQGSTGADGEPGDDGLGPPLTGTSFDPGLGGDSACGRYGGHGGTGGREDHLQGQGEKGQDGFFGADGGEGGLPGVKFEGFNIGESGKPGDPGTLISAEGSPGVGGNGDGYIESGAWFASLGTEGTRGGHGNGGGGGGGGGHSFLERVCEINCRTVFGFPVCTTKTCFVPFPGFGGGGGGGSGCSGYGGDGGKGGGGSFGIFLSSASPAIVNNVISTVGGGAGGNGGAGGDGGKGGAGGELIDVFGRPCPPDKVPCGGKGGTGGDGAKGGSGGGGGGGPSCGIYRSLGSDPGIGFNTFTGPGGVSDPLIGPAGPGGAPGGEQGIRGNICPPPLPALELPPINVPSGGTVNVFPIVPLGTFKATFSSSWIGSTVETTLVAPSGRIFDRNTVAPDVTRVLGPTFEVYSITNPEPGEWEIQLFGADVPQVGEEATVSVTTTAANQPPLANAGTDLTVEATSPAGANVMLNGAASSDPDGDALTFEWKDGANNVVGTGEQLEQTVPLESHSFDLTVDDARGGMDSDAVTVTVQDTISPRLTLSNRVITVTLPTATAAGASVDLSGIATATDTVDPSVTITHDGPVSFPIGVTLVTLTASDNSGNANQVPLFVQVVYDFGGFLSPIGRRSSFKVGQIISVKFQLTAADGSLVTDATPQLVVFKVTDDGLEGAQVVSAGHSNSDVAFRFDPEENQYVYDLSTTSYSPGTYLLRVFVNDLTIHEVQVSIR